MKRLAILFAISFLLGVALAVVSDHYQETRWQMVHGWVK